jgi:hypothetical protein
VSTGPGVSAGASGPAPRVPRQTAADTPSPAYGDWTKPSLVDAGPATAPDAVAGPAVAPRVRNALGTTAVPERPTSGRPELSVDTLDDDAPPPTRGPGTGPVVGGRAALRAERQAADMARRKAAKRSGSSVAVLDGDEDGVGRKPRRAVKGLLAMVVVALGVLGVYSFVSPETQETAAQTPAGTSSTPALTGDAAPLPALPTTPVVEPTSTAPVRVPVTVLNATDVNGLAATISSAVVAAGWESPGTGPYTAGDVAASTVFFTEGDETQRQAAVQLVDQFPQLQGPTPRFFELPPDVPAPGLVIVASGDWQP